MTDPGFFYYFFLVIALGIGWTMAWLSFKPRLFHKRSANEIYHDYFVGLNYLLGNEPDESLDTFIRVLEVNGETYESHLALGTLLRRRGKVDKAIKVHQTLLSKTEADSQFAETVRLELAKDYIASGLFDRAERLLNELVQDYSNSRPEALLQLTTVFQVEKEWEKAIEAVSALKKLAVFKKDKSIRSLGAHFCCELAEQAFSRGQIPKAREHVKRAFHFDRTSVRASLMLAKIEQKANNYHTAIGELERIRNQHPEFISELVAPMAECYEELADGAEKVYFENFLRSCLEKKPGTSVLLKLTELVQQREGNKSAGMLLTQALRRNPSLKGMVELLRLNSEQAEGQTKEDLLQVSEALKKLIQGKPAYQCEQCGFESKSLFWQCPSCQKWDSIKPKFGIEGE